MTQKCPSGRTLAEWLDYQLSVHTQEIELGLARVETVASRLDLLTPAHRTITVAGTNGKGSTVALIAGALGGHGRVGTYTSPHLWRYNERIAIDGVPVDDGELVLAFEAIEAVRDTIALTYFEFGTLAALWLLAGHRVDIAVLEVGLGGRLDAVNIIDADIAVITQIGLDHTAWLGDTREAIGAEKAGIARANRPVICADRDPPTSIKRTAERVGAPLSLIGRDFDITLEDTTWHWSGARSRHAYAAHQAVHADNMGAALAAIEAAGLEPSAADVERACQSQAKLPGRREVIDGDIPIIYDVGHNNEAVELLARMLEQRPVAGRTHIVLGMLSDKPVETVGARLASLADRLYPAGLDTVTSRGLEASALANRLGLSGPTYATPGEALAAARANASNGDRIVVTGSFFTVAQVRSPET